MKITDKIRLDWLTKNAWLLARKPLHKDWVLRCKHPTSGMFTRTITGVESPRKIIDAAIKAALKSAGKRGGGKA